ncbi:MAG: hypothetical protein K0U78_08160 [Actinomycetia bacterium]|nr:hypothetical protein [Actinomycetes bacterium]
MSPSRANVDKVEEAGEYLAQGLALLVSTEFDDVSFEPKPLGLAKMTSTQNTTPWRVRFAWIAPDRANEIDDDDGLIESL